MLTAALLWQQQRVAREVRGGDWRRCTVQINYPMHSFAAPDVRVERNNKRFSFIDRSIRLPCNALFPTYLRVLPPPPPHFPPQFGSLVLQFSSSTINANRFHLQTLFVQHFRESFNKLCAWHFPGNFSATTNVPSCCSCCCCPCWLCCCNRCSLLALACWIFRIMYEFDMDNMTVASAGHAPSSAARTWDYTKPTP